MKTYRTPFFVVGTAALLVVGLYVCDAPGRHQRAEQKTLIEKELAQFIQTGPTNRTALSARVSAYSVLQRLSPLFALSGTDPEELKREAKKFSFYGSQMLALFENPSHTLQQGLYPHRIFSLLPDLEKARRNVMAHPTYGTVTQHNTLLHKTLDAYEEDLNDYEHALRTNATDAERKGQINFPGGITSVEDILHALGTLRAELHHARNTQRARMNCVREHSESCESLSNAFKKIVSSVPPSSPHAPEISLASAINIKNQTYDLFWGEGSRERLLQEHIFVLSTPSCTQSPDASWYVVAKTDLISHYMFPLDAIYMFDIQTFELEHPPLIGLTQEVKEAGAHYIYQNKSNLYFCPHNAATLTEALTAQAIQEELARKSLFSTHKEEMETQELAAIEEHITHQPYTDSTYVAYFVYKTSVLLSSTGEVRLAEILGKESVLRMERILQTWNEKSGHMDAAIEAAMRTNIETWHLMAANNITPFGFLVSRSYPYLFFMPMNRSIASATVLFGKDAEDLFGLTTLESIESQYGHEYVQKELSNIRSATQRLKEKYPVPR